MASGFIHSDHENVDIGSPESSSSDDSSDIDVENVNESEDNLLPEDEDSNADQDYQDALHDFSDDDDADSQSGSRRGRGAGAVGGEHVHNALERKRRENLTRLFFKLNKVLSSQDMALQSKEKDSKSKGSMSKDAVLEATANALIKNQAKLQRLEDINARMTDLLQLYRRAKPSAASNRRQRVQEPSDAGPSNSFSTTSNPEPAEPPPAKRQRKAKD